MSTAIHTANISNSFSKSEKDGQAEKRDFLFSLEEQMKNVWHQYVERLDERGLDENAQQLRDKYFNLYRCYKMNKEWVSTLAKDVQS